MTDLIGAALDEWTRGLFPRTALICVYRRIREIPYAVVPELNHPDRYQLILQLGKGSCMPKHFLLAEMLQRLGLTVLYAVYPFRWDETGLSLPGDLKKLAQRMPEGHHLACRVLVEDRFSLVDATLDTPLAHLGASANPDWDGINDTPLPVVPVGEEQLYHPCEAALMVPPTPGPLAAEFYQRLNSWLDDARRQYLQTSAHSAHLRPGGTLLSEQ